MQGHDARARGEFTPVVWGVLTVLLSVAGLSVTPHAAGAEKACFTSSPNAPKPGELVVFDATCSEVSNDPDNPTYRWSFGDGTYDTRFRPDHIYPSAGMYTVTLTLQRGNAISTISHEITVGDAPPPVPPNQAPTARIQISSAHAMLNEDVTFDASESSDPDGDALSYRWTFGDGHYSTFRIVSRPYRQLGKYAVSLTVTDRRGATGVAAGRIAVAAPPPPPPTRSRLTWLILLILLITTILSVSVWAGLRGVRLMSEGKSLKAGDIVLRTPGLDGKVRVQRHNGAIPQSALLTPQFREALAREGFRLERTVEIRDAKERESFSGETFASRHDEAAFALELPPQEPGSQRVLLSANESGVLEWIYQGEIVDGLTRYLARRHVPVAVGEALRGLIPAATKKIVHVLTFKLVDAAAGAVGRHFAAAWEERKRPYALRSFTPADRRIPGGAVLDDQAWRHLASGPVLLFIHGTFSRAHAAFGGLPDAVFTELYQRYEGRVIAFDHFTLSHDPKRNVEWLLGAVPPGLSLTFDVICHSRGGLVSRVLAEKAVDAERDWRVRRVIFVATPNAGTVLADSRFIGDFLDAHTNLLNWFPQGDVVEGMQGILTAVKHMAVGALDGLEGLTAMRPGGPFLEWLNAGPRGPSDYFALTSNFDCRRSGVTDLLYNGFMDRVFGAENDLVVPTRGVYDGNGSEYFPIKERKVFLPTDRVSHGGFFANRGAQDAVLRWAKR